MNILAVADIHGDLEKLYRLVDGIEKEGKRPDLVLIAGDLTPFGPGSLVKPIEAKLKELSRYVLAVPGNEDPEEVRKAMRDMDIHGKTVKLNDVTVIGFEGARWISSDEGVFISYDPIHETLKKAEGKKILLTHVPPFDTEADRLWTGQHAGSPFLRSLVEEYQPDLVICGHIHESRGVDRIKKSTILNPGALADGYAAWIEMKEEPEITLLKIDRKGLKKERVMEAIKER